MKKSKTISILLIVVLVCMSLLGACGGGEVTEEPAEEEMAVADAIYTNGIIYTVDADRSVAEAIAVQDGKIMAVGTTDEISALAGEETDVVDLAGQLVLPGFFEAHGHLQSATELTYAIDLKAATSGEEYQQLIQDFLDANPDTEVITGFGWSNTVFGAEGPNKDILDAVTTELPICLTSEDHHSYWANSKALEMGGVTKDTPNPDATSVIMKDANGEPTGCLREGAGSLVTDVLPDYTVDQYKAGIQSYLAMANSLGFTGGLDAIIGPGSNALQAYIELAQEGALTMHLKAAFPLDPTATAEDIAELAAARDAVPESDLFGVTTVKVFADGVIEGLTGLLLEPYNSEGAGTDPDYKGIPEWDQDAMNEAFAAAEAAGFQVHTHAIGDGAVKMTVDAIEYAQAANNSSDNRHAITHLQLVAPEDFARFGELGIIAAINPYWMFKDDYYYNLQLPFLGEERAELEYPVKSFLDAGALLSGASDYPITLPPNPLEGMQIGVTRTVPETPDGVLSYGMETDVGNPKYDLPLWPEESVTLEDMVLAFTYNGAYGNFLEDVTGSIEVGKSADFVILEKNIFEAEITELRDIAVLKTIFKGDVVYEK